MLDTSGNHDDLAFRDVHGMITKLHPEAAADHEEEFILIRMCMPHVFTGEFRQLHVLPVELGDDPR